jgi:hypothetical protein
MANRKNLILCVGLAALGVIGLSGCSKDGDTADQKVPAVGTKPPSNVHLETDGKATGGAPAKNSMSEGG